MLNDWLGVYFTINILEGNPDNKIYGDARIFLGDPLEGDYVINLKKGTFSDVWDDVSTDRNYGTGTLDTALNASDQTIVINIRGFAYDQFKNGDLCY
ncbi:MAG: hypothetical protein QM487_04065 [Candidatus Marithrix sp.]